MALWRDDDAAVCAVDDPFRQLELLCCTALHADAEMMQRFLLCSSPAARSWGGDGLAEWIQRRGFALVDSDLCEDVRAVLAQRTFDAFSLLATVHEGALAPAQDGAVVVGLHGVAARVAAAACRGGARGVTIVARAAVVFDALADVVLRFLRRRGTEADVVVVAELLAQLSADFDDSPLGALPRAHLTQLARQALPRPRKLGKRPRLRPRSRGYLLPWSCRRSQ
ncbi:hypothetical protein M885DRAFT_614682 [Pelagophyceae sp. CCMP2097]|nr:hypothetical protein M885DRAFT_614682 [Pelagophyceae sp. CCMP2097]